MSSSAAPLMQATRAPAGSPTWRRYSDYLRRAPLLVLEWADSETPARGWLVINSLRGGAAGGGTRMRAGLTRQEVVYLAKAMELKFAFSGPPIGGAKSGIDFDPTDPRRPEVLRRWFRAIAPQLRHCYGTGGDLNVDEVLDVIPCCEELGLSHPQEGIVRGHLQPGPGTLTRILASLDHGVKAPVTDEFGIPGLPLPVADLITGYGLARSIVRTYEALGRPIRGARVTVEGFGAVGGSCALYLAREGALIVGIADREKVLVEPRGMGAGEVEALLRARVEKLLPRTDPRCYPAAERSRFWAVPAEIFVSAACSGTLDEAVLGTLARQGVHTLACGANQPFREFKLGTTRVQRLADQRFTIIPDVVANSGMARALSYLMQDYVELETAPIFRAVDETISEAVAGIGVRASGRSSGWLANTLAYALDQLGYERLPSGGAGRTSGDGRRYRPHRRNPRPASRGRMSRAPLLPKVMKESSALTTQQIEQLQEELLRTLARLRRSMKISGQAARPVELDQSCVGRLSRIDAIQNQGLMQNLQEREKVQLAQVLDALKRIEEGHYGFCSACGRPIQSERLLVFPETRTCTPCSRACGA